uniref:Uncharacterized protein n=1 Tax=Meloidogyne incognita TaxID=6306 RepID=A0A914L5F0_MELIC
MTRSFNQVICPLVNQYYMKSTFWSFNPYRVVNLRPCSPHAGLAKILKSSNIWGNIKKYLLYIFGIAIYKFNRKF